jgi:hypothetical protein
MRIAALLLVAGVLAAPALAAGPPAPKSVAPAPKPLAKQDRDGIAHLLGKAIAKAKPRLAYAPLTLAEARRVADVPAWLSWQVEYDGWFVFGVHDRAGGPDPWSGVFFIRRGTNLIGFFRETW